MTHQQIQAFIQEFLSNVPPLDEGLKVLPHDLLYDFGGRYRNVRFTSQQLQACVDGYVALIEPVIDALGSSSESFIHPSNLYTLKYHDATELLLAYFHHTPHDEHFTHFVTHLIEIDAVRQIEQLLDTVDPDKKYRMVDAVKRITSLHELVSQLVNKVE